MDGESAQCSPGPRIAELAAAQHGVVSLAQLEAAGLGPGAIYHRVRAGSLHRVHRGVYAVGQPRLTREGRWLAAVLACGTRAALSHRSAAALWELRPSAASAVDVTVASRTGRRRRDGMTVHRSTTLRAADVTLRHGIPVTTVARTLLDLAAVLSPRALERGTDQAEARRLFDLRAIEGVLGANRGHVGARRLAALLERHLAGSTLTRSELEERFLELCAAHDLPRPAVNACVESHEVDFLWRSRHLIAETDGHRHHRTRAGFERDRVRDARLLVAGYRVVRFTYRQVTHEPDAVADVLRSLLGGARRAAALETDQADGRSISSTR